MDIKKKNAIEVLIDASIRNFAEGLTSRYERELTCEDGVINMKKKIVKF